jgi:hypothetical protein
MLLPELATGATAGDDRGWVLTHLSGCAQCRRELDQLTTTADALLTLAPSVEPPPGFEGAVLAGLRMPVASGDAASPGPVRAARWRLPRWFTLRRTVAGLAFALALCLAAAGGALVVHSRAAEDRRLAEQYRTTLTIGDGRYLRAARLTTGDGRDAGTVFLYRGNPSWVMVAVTAAPRDGSFAMLAIDRQGAAHRVGTCRITNGAGTYGVQLPLTVAEISQIQLRSVDPPELVLTGTT